MEKLSKYALISSTQHLPLEVTIHSMTDTGVVISVKEEIQEKEYIIACPIETIFSEITIENIKSHPKRIEGIVTRVTKKNQISVQLSAAAIKKSSSVQIEGKGLFTKLILNGSPDLSNFIKFHDLIQKNAPCALRMIIDMSLVASLPQTGYVILKKLIAHLIEENKQVLLVCPICEYRLNTKDLPDSPNFELFSTMEEAEDYSQQTPFKILIVEDDKTSLLIIENILLQWNFKPISATLAEEGIRLALREKPSLILMDYHLPEMDGLQATRILRDNPKTADIPIIMLTSESRREIVAQSIRYNIDGYILKPLDPETFLPKIVQILESTPNSLIGALAP